MNSSMIGTIDKARRYAQEPERMHVSALAATFHGGHDDYALSLTDDHWRCTCHTFEQHESCPHVMAAQRLLAPMLPTPARYEATTWAGTGTSIIGKLEKARRYADEPERIALTGLAAALHGSNDIHDLALRDGHWQCACHTFEQHTTCAHVMAAQRLLSAMLPEPALV